MRNGPAQPRLHSLKPLKLLSKLFEEAVEALQLAVPV